MSQFHNFSPKNRINRLTVNQLCIRQTIESRVAVLTQVSQLAIRKYFDLYTFTRLEKIIVTGERSPCNPPNVHS